MGPPLQHSVSTSQTRNWRFQCFTRSSGSGLMGFIHGHLVPNNAEQWLTRLWEEFINTSPPALLAPPVLLELADAYFHVELASEYQKVITTNTHRGPKQLAPSSFGVKTALDIFQSAMDTNPRGTMDVSACPVNTLMTGLSADNSCNRLAAVVEGTHDFGPRLR